MKFLRFLPQIAFRESQDSFPTARSQKSGLKLNWRHLTENCAQLTEQV